MSERKSNYDIQADTARELFLDWDQEKMISRFGLEHDQSFLYIDFFGETHKIDRKTGEVFLINGDEASFSAVMSIFDVLCYAKDGAVLSGEWRTLHTLSPHSNFGASGRTLHKREEQLFSGKTERLHEICHELGGTAATKADVGYIFDAFTFLPMLFQFWEGDEEFSPKLSFLFDSNTLDFMRFETAWYVAGQLIRLIEKRL